MLADRIEEQAKVNATYLEQIKGKVSLLGALNEKQVMNLLSYMDRKTFAAGEKIFSQEDLPSEIHIISSGRVHLTVTRQDDTVSSMDFLPGDCFGETAVIGIQPQMGDAIALGRVETLVLTKSSLMELLEEDIDLFGILMMNIARDVSRRFHYAMLSPNETIERSVTITH